MPDKMSQEKVRLLKAFGAEVIVTPTAVPPDHPDNYVMMAKRIAQETPNAILANQFYNQANPEAHYATTGPEIWEQTEGRITHFVAAAGTGGTITGVGQLPQGEEPEDPDHRRRSRRARSLAELWRSKGRHGRGRPVQGRGDRQDKIPGTLDFDCVDEFRTVSDRDVVRDGAPPHARGGAVRRRVGGLIAHVALHVARELDDPDALRRHLPLRHRRALSLEAVQRRVDAREPAARHAPAARSATCSSGGRPARRPLVSVAPAAAVRQALNLMSTWGVSQIPVLDDGECVGGLIEGTLMTRALAQPALLDRPVREVMDAAVPRGRRRRPPTDASARCSRARARRRWCGRTASWWAS